MRIPDEFIKRSRREVDSVDACCKRFLNVKDVNSARVGVMGGSVAGKLSIKVLRVTKELSLIRKEEPIAEVPGSKSNVIKSAISDA